MVGHIMNYQIGCFNQFVLRVYKCMRCKEEERRMKRRYDGWMDGWMDGWKGGWMARRTNEWVGGRESSTHYQDRNIGEKKE